MFSIATFRKKLCCTAAAVLSCALLAQPVDTFVLHTAAKQSIPDFSYLGAVGSLSEQETQKTAEAIYLGLYEHADHIALQPYGLDITQQNYKDFSAVYREVAGGFTVGLLTDASYISYSSGADYIYPSYFIDDPDEYAAELKTLRSEIREIMSGVGYNWSEAERALYLHDYLVVHFDYDYMGLYGYEKRDGYEMHTAYGMLRNRAGVCDGYTRLYTMLLHEAGINSVYVSNDAINHSWNYVCIDGDWYFTDVTWDDAYYTLAGKVSHQNFLCTSEEIIKTDHFGGPNALTDDDGNLIEDAWLCPFGDILGIDVPTDFTEAFWKDCSGAIERYQNQWVTPVSTSGKVSFMLYSYNNDTRSARSTTLVTLDSSNSTWYNPDSGGRFTNVFTVPEVVDDVLYFTTPNSICAYQNGSILRLYTLTAEQQKESSVYGLYAEGDTMYVGTARTPNTVTRNPDDPTEPIFAPAAYSTLDLSELHDTVIEIAGESNRKGTDVALNYWVEPLSIEDWQYGDTPSKPTAIPAFGTPRFYYTSVTDGTYTQTVPIEPGSYYVIAVVEPDYGDAYSPLESEPMEFEIINNTVTITPDAAVISYLDPVPELGFTISGGLTQAQSDAIEAAVKLMTDYKPGDPAGTYTITAAIDETLFPNYTFDLGTADLTVRAIAPTVSFKPSKLDTVYTGEPFVLPEGVLQCDYDLPEEQYRFSWEVLQNGVITEMDDVPVNAGTYRLTARIGDTGNIRSNSATMTLRIVPAELTISAENQIITYGDALPESLPVTYTGLCDADAGIFPDTLPITFKDGTPSGAGVYPMTLVLPETDNYTITADTPNLTIGKRTLTITPTPLNLEYGDALPASLPVSCKGLLRSDSTLLAGIKVTTPYVQYKDAGSYVLTAQPPELESYDVVCKPGTLTVAPHPVTFAWDAQSFVYDGEQHSVQPEIIGLLHKDSVDVTLTGDSAVNAGTYTAKITGLSSANYTFDPADETLAANWEITKAPLTVTPVDLTLAYGDKLPVTELTYDGFCGTDSKKDLHGKAERVSDYQAGDDTGTYTLTLDSTLQADNYEILCGEGTLTVLPKSVTLTWGGDLNTNFNGQTKTVTAKADGLPESEEVTLTLTGNKATAAGTYTAKASLTGKKAGNFVLDGETEMEWTILPLDMIVTRPTPLTCTYTGELQPLVKAGEVNGGTLWYALDDGEPSEELPMALDAGSYVVSYEATPDENRSGSVKGKLNVTIAPLDLTDNSDLQIAIPDCILQEQTAVPEVTVTLGGTALTEGTDYTVTFSGNDSPGTGLAAITFVGNYTGSAEQRFGISAMETTTTSTTVATAATTTTTTVTSATTSTTKQTTTTQQTTTSAQTTSTTHTTTASTAASSTDSTKKTTTTSQSTKATSQTTKVTSPTTSQTTKPTTSGTTSTSHSKTTAASTTTTTSTTKKAVTTSSTTSTSLTTATTTSTKATKATTKATTVTTPTSTTTTTTTSAATTTAETSATQTTATETTPTETPETQPAIIGYEFKTNDLMRMCLADDDTALTVAELIAELQQRALYSNGKTGNWEPADLSMVSIPEVTPASLYDGSQAQYTGSLDATITYTLPDGTEHTLQQMVGEITVVQRGDCNGDGVVAADDAAEILIYAAAVGGGETPSLDEAALLACDTNGDGSINASDAANVLIYASIRGASGTADWSEVLEG